MIKKIKKIVAGISAIVLMATATACGSDTKWALQYGDYEARAGIFLFYQMSAYSEAISTLQEDNPDLDVTDTKAIKELSIEDTPIVDWIQNEATEKVELYLQVLKQFDELGLELSEDDLTYIDNLTDTYWQYYSEYYTQNGIGEQSFKDINTYSYKMNAVFDYYYAEGGVEEVPEQDLKDYYEENNARVKYICLNSTDADGNFLSTDMKSMAEDYLKRANDGESFDALIDEYNDYKTKLAEEQAQEAETSTSESEGTLDSTSAEASNEEDTNSISEETVNDTDTETTDDTSNDNVTIGDSDAEVTTYTTETEDEENPYPNEYVVSKSEDEGSGSPTYKVNQEIFAHSTFNDAFLVEEDNAYYVVVKYDIWERDDLWTDDTKQSTLVELKTDDFNEKLMSMVDTDSVVKNSKAYSRYNPLEMKF
ncbi:MAG: hypothetical protein ACI4WH_08315 [Oscillospiraceae bacterium]